MAHIIVVEDNAQSARLVEKLLRRNGHHVESYSTGEEGLTRVFEAAPDVVLIDLGLPDIDGQTVIALIHQQPSLAATKLIAFTAWPQETARSIAAAYGCDGVITKPINTRTFPQVVESYCPDSTSLLETQESKPFDDFEGPAKIG